MTLAAVCEKLIEDELFYGGVKVCEGGEFLHYSHRRLCNTKYTCARALSLSHTYIHVLADICSSRASLVTCERFAKVGERVVDAEC